MILPRSCCCVGGRYDLNRIVLENSHSRKATVEWIGAKINVAKTLLLNANVLFPMSDAGLKPKPTLVVGLDYVF